MKLLTIFKHLSPTVKSASSSDVLMDIPNNEKDKGSTESRCQVIPA